MANLTNGVTMNIINVNLLHYSDAERYDAATTKFKRNR